MISQRRWLTVLTAAVFVALTTLSAGPASAGKLEKLNARMAVIEKQLDRAKGQVAKDAALRRLQGIQSRIAKLEKNAASQKKRSRRAAVTPVSLHWSWPADSTMSEAARRAKHGGMMPEQWDRLFGTPSPSHESIITGLIQAINLAQTNGNTYLMNQKIAELQAKHLEILQHHDELAKRRKTYLIGEWDRLKGTSLTFDQRVGEMLKHSDCRSRCTFRMSTDALEMGDQVLIAGQGVTW